MPFAQMLVVGVETGCMNRRVAGHELDAAADHRLLLAGHDAHGGERHRLLAAAAKAVQGDAGHRQRPAGVQHRHAGNVVGVVAAARAAASHHVLYVRRVKADAFLKAVQDLGQATLGMEVAQGANARLAPASGRTGMIDDPSFAHGVSSVCDWKWRHSSGPIQGCRQVTN